MDRLAKAQLLRNKAACSSIGLAERQALLAKAQELELRSLADSLEALAAVFAKFGVSAAETSANMTGFYQPTVSENKPAGNEDDR